MVGKNPDITLACRVQPSPNAMIQRSGDELIVLDTASERYFGLNEVGAQLWQLLVSDPELAHAHQHLLDQYDVVPADLERDLVTLVARLADEGLVTID